MQGTYNTLSIAYPKQPLLLQNKQTAWSTSLKPSTLPSKASLVSDAILVPLQVDNVQFVSSSRASRSRCIVAQNFRVINITPYCFCAKLFTCARIDVDQQWSRLTALDWSRGRLLLGVTSFVAAKRRNLKRRRCDSVVKCKEGDGAAIALNGHFVFRLAIDRRW